MRLETFFEKFELFADAPGAVARMRELVLWSAFSGTFSGEERDQRMPDEWSSGERPVLPSIPSSWNWQQGRDVFDVIRGVSYKKNDASDSPVEGSFPVLRANNIGNGINFDELVYVPRDNIGDEQFVRRGDILIAMSSGSKKLVGKAALIETEFNGSFGAFCGVVRNKSTIPDEFLSYYFRSPQYTSWVIAAGRGIGINNLSRSDLDSLPVPTPPLAEQKRIVAKVNELMALCDQLEAQQQERAARHAALASVALARFAEAPTPANLDFLFHPSYAIAPADLRKAILSLAVQGKLVPQDPNDEPAAVGLSRLGLKSTLVTSNVVDDPDDIMPSSWTRARFEDVALVAGGVTLGRKLGAGKVVSLPYLRVANVKRGEVDLGVIKEISIAEDELDRYALRENDLLMTEGGDWDKVGRAAIWRAPIPLCLHQNHVFRARMRAAEIAPEWFERYFNSPVGRAYFESAAKQTTNLASINMRQVRGCSVPLPPFAEQHRIVAKVDQLMALVDRLEAQLASSRAAAEKLLGALVAELTAPRSKAAA